MSLSRMNVTSISAWSQAMTGERRLVMSSALKCGFSDSGARMTRETNLANGFTNGTNTYVVTRLKSVCTAAIGAAMCG